MYPEPVSEQRIRKSHRFAMESLRPRSPVPGSSLPMDNETPVEEVIASRKGPFQSHGLENVNLMSRILAELEEPTPTQPPAISTTDVDDDTGNAPLVNDDVIFSSFFRTDTGSSSRSITESTLERSYFDSPAKHSIDSESNNEVDDVDNRKSIAAILKRSMSEQMAAAAEFARERSAVMPTLPAGALPLLWTFVFFIGVSLTAYMSLCKGPGECMDPGAMLTSLRQLDGESANEFFERARASVAPTADYVVEHLKQMWSRICDGEVSQLSQLLTDKNIRVAVLMYLGAVITICGGYFTITTMDCGNTLSSSYAQLLSSLNTKERLASVTKRFEENSTAFAQWRDAATASMFREEEDKCGAPTPIISLSSFVISIARVVQWVTSFAAGKKSSVKLDTEQTRREEAEKLRIRKRALWLTPEINSFTELDTLASPESSSAHFGNQFSIFLRAREPQILSFLQRLDVTAAILGMLFLLLVLFLYHKSIKQFLSYCIVPTVCVVTGCGVGRIGYIVYSWVSRTRELRNKQISILSASARSHLSLRHKGGPYPVDFIFEELKDLLFNASVDSVIRNSQPNTPVKVKNNIEKVVTGQDIDIKTFKKLWHLVVIDVLQDKRILSIVMIYEGARRTCWKSLGAKEEIPRPSIPPADSTKVPVPSLDTTPKFNPVAQRKGALGYIVFIFRVLLVLFSGILNVFGFVAKQVWKWMR